MKRILLIILAALALAACGETTPTPSPDMHDYCDGSLFQPLTCDDL